MNHYKQHTWIHITNKEDNNLQSNQKRKKDRVCDNENNE